MKFENQKRFNLFQLKVNVPFFNNIVFQDQNLLMVSRFAAFSTVSALLGKSSRSTRGLTSKRSLFSSNTNKPVSN